LKLRNTNTSKNKHASCNGQHKAWHNLEVLSPGSTLSIAKLYMTPDNSAMHKSSTMHSRMLPVAASCPHSAALNHVHKLFLRSFFGEFFNTNRMSKGDCMADCPDAVSSGLILRAQLVEEERMRAQHDREDPGCGRSNFLRMLRAFCIPARSVATQAG